MNARDLAVVQGWDGTRRTLAAWNRRPVAAVGPWVRLSAAIAAGLLTCVWLVALASTPDPTPVRFPGVTRPAVPADALSVVERNLLVLALHALACLAGFIAKSALPREARAYRGWWRRVHDRASPAALAFVAGATVFSLATQAYALGSGLATLSAQFGTSPGALLLALTPHAVPELTALFLPLAAWLIAARAGAWHELMAATITTTALAIPVIVAAAVVEVAVTPQLLRALHFV